MDVSDAGACGAGSFDTGDDLGTNGPAATMATAAAFGKQPPPAGRS